MAEPTVQDSGGEQRVGDLTNRHVISVEPKTSLRVVIEHFVEAGVGFVVVDDGGSVAGVVSERDVMRAIHDGADLDEVWAADIMSIDLVTADSDTTVLEAARLMANNRIRHLIVMGDQSGVISIRNILESLVGAQPSSSDSTEASPSR